MIRFVVVWAALGLAGDARAQGVSPCPLARLPAAFTMQSLAPEVVGEPVEIRVTMSAEEPLVDVHLEVSVPPGVEVLAPLPSWTGTLAAGETAAIVARVRSPDHPAWIKARAWRQVGAARLTAIDREPIGPAPLSKPTLPPIRTDQEGTTRLLLPMRSASP